MLWGMFPWCACLPACLWSRQGSTPACQVFPSHFSQRTIPSPKSSQSQTCKVKCSVTHVQQRHMCKQQAGMQMQHELFHVSVLLMINARYFLFMPFHFIAAVTFSLLHPAHAVLYYAAAIIFIVFIFSSPPRLPSTIRSTVCWQRAW